MSVRSMMIAVLILLTGACGWQLRGSVALSSLTDTLHLTSPDDYGALMVELRNRLSADDIRLTDSPTEARYTLRVNRELVDKRVAAVGSDALASAYELTLRAEFDVLDQRGIPIATRLVSSVTRSYNASSGSAGSSAQEEVLLTREMRTELAQQILRQLQAAINAAQAEGLVSDAPDAPDEPPNGETTP